MTGKRAKLLAPSFDEIDSCHAGNSPIARRGKAVTWQGVIQHFEQVEIRRQSAGPDAAKVNKIR